MGEHKVSAISGSRAREKFIDHVLKDVEALEKMLDLGMFEQGVTRIGAEQELCLVDPAWRPAPVNLEVLQKISDPHFTTELAKFNLEINLDPLLFTGTCLSDLEARIKTHLGQAELAAQEVGAKILLTGILPTIKHTDLLENMMTPIERYKSLNKVMKKYRGGEFEFHIEGTDELIARHNSVMFESGNTSFQIHFQINPEDFSEKYNWAQLISAPVLAAAVNSPLLFGKRLWKETRIALFQQSIDIRNSSDLMRERSPRVSFGNRWFRKSLVDFFQEDIVRHRILLSNNIEKDSLEQLANGEMPNLDALRVHNSTIYKWNRPCFGVNDGVAHIRIENRLLPSGPSLVDQVANTAFWAGLMASIPPHAQRLYEKMEFHDAKTNVYKASVHGMDTSVVWCDGRKYSVHDLILQELLPIARDGLAGAGIVKKDISKYLDVIEERASSGKTGSMWILNSFNKLLKEGSKDEALVATTAGIYHRQRDGAPCHQWDSARITEAGSWINYYWRIDQIMSTDLFAIQEDDYVDLVASIMDWRRVRHVPVENKSGKLVGLITSGLLVKYLYETRRDPSKGKSIKDIMVKNPVTCTPETLTKRALGLMKKNKIGCLPVVKKGKLVGIVTEHDFVDISFQLLKELST